MKNFPLLHACWWEQRNRFGKQMMTIALVVRCKCLRLHIIVAMRLPSVNVLSVI